MIAWQEILHRYKERKLFISECSSTSFADFHKRVVQSSTCSIDTNCVAHHLQWTAASFAQVLGLAESGRSVVLNDGAQTDQLAKFNETGPFLVLQSGGTTGLPRHVVHRFTTFLKPYAVKKSLPKRWMVLYAADHIAGIDAFLQALHRGSSLVLPKDWSASTIGGAIDLHRVEVLAATPSMLQFLLLGGLQGSHDLTSVKSIAHGAEPMPDSLRKRLTQAFPNARLLNRFGLTELGALPVRSGEDNKDTFKLDAPGYAWKVVDGELYIQSPTTCIGSLEDGPFVTDDHWYPTGDMVESLPGGAFRILGRRESVINVGGTKVYPGQIEELLLDDGAVEDASVYAEPHAITGKSVAAKVVFTKAADPEGLLRRIRKRTVDMGWPLAGAPTRITPVAEIGMTHALKKERLPDCHKNNLP